LIYRFHLAHSAARLHRLWLENGVRIGSSTWRCYRLWRDADTPVCAVCNPMYIV